MDNTYQIVVFKELRSALKTLRSKLFLILTLLTLCYFLEIQEANAQSCGSLSGIINTYAPVTAISGNTVTIGTTSGAAAPFAIGDFAVLIQMTGTAPVQTGSNMGKYELRKVTSLTGGVVLDGIVNTYTLTEKVQLVRVPYCPTGTISGTVTAKVWDGSTGGIVALNGITLTMNADIDATGTGFSQTNRPTTVTTASLSTGAGTTNGRGYTSPKTLGGIGGGGIGGGGGLSGGGSFGGGGIGGGAKGAAGGAPPPNNFAIAGGGAGVDGGVGKYGSIYLSGGGGGGGGVIGGGGGGGRDGTTSGSTGGGGGGGTDGGAGGGGLAGGGGGPRGVGNGANAGCNDGCSGAGGGSYGGGGAAASSFSGGDDSWAGGGGGSWTGGGISGRGGTRYPQFAGNGNDPVTTVIPNTAHFLNTTKPRIMMGGAGGNSFCQTEGFGGGIIILDFTSEYKW